ncbi:MAG: glycoside hydrolase family 127 protein [Verrucomicrobia bacterium]|nr:glycoside hydrolase family 127 protein [Verrucomicrobiota bacterium]
MQSLCAAEEATPTAAVPITQITRSTQYGAPREDFLVGTQRHKGFVILPRQPSADGARPWLWYAPTFVQPPGGLPDPSHAWMFAQLLTNGFAIAGVDVGESYGNPAGRAAFTEFHRAVVQRYGLAPKACLLPQSRGGLMLYNWAAEHPERVQCIGGIYTVCDQSSWPGLAKSSPAYGLDEAGLAAQLREHNPIDRLAPLAKARIPILHLHGDADTVVPLERNSGELARRYRALGGEAELVVVKGKGHEVCPEFFQNQRVVDFFLRQGKPFAVESAPPFHTAEPRVPLAFTPLPPGAVEPHGWLRDWALAARDGITGHLDERHPTYQNGWKGFGFAARGASPDGTGWPLEQCAYWLDGAVRLALVLHDEPLLRKVRARLDPVVAGVPSNQTTLIHWKDRDAVQSSTNSWFGAFNCWAHSHLARALLACYEGTGDRRILEALRIAYRDFPLPDVSPHFSAGIPGEVNIDPMLEVVRLSGDARVLAQVLAFAQRPAFRKTVAEQWPALAEPVRCGHGVCFNEGTRVPALLYPWTGERWMLDATLAEFDWAERRHMLPCGVPSSEEFMAGIGAFRAIETCNLPCWIYSQVWLLRIVGAGRFGDAAELAFFNAGPAPIARDWQTMCYYQSPNRLSPTLPGSEPTAPGPGCFQFTPIGHEVLCCVGNLNRLIPNYIIPMWMTTPDHGLAATLYGPCAVSAKAGDGVSVKLTCDTAYPFEETIRVSVEPARDAEFPLYFRVPQWCREPQIRVGRTFKPLRRDANGFAKLTRTWRKGDVVTLRFPMPVRVLRGRENPYPQSDYFKRAGSKQTRVNSPFASVYCGPLLFALAIPDLDANTVAAGARWQYALDFDGRRADAGIKVVRRGQPEKWRWQLDAPVALTVPARAFDWQPTDEQPLPAAPVEGAERISLQLVPYGCTKFRVSMFPVTAKAWRGQ